MDLRDAQTFIYIRTEPVVDLLERQIALFRDVFLLRRGRVRVMQAVLEPLLKELDSLRLKRGAVMGCGVYRRGTNRGLDGLGIGTERSININRTHATDGIGQ